MKARIFNIQKYSIYDGPGIRTLVFFKGCPLRCLWCANPEGKSATSSIMWNSAVCTHCGLCATVCRTGQHRFENGRHGVSRNNCTGCNECAKVCPQRAIKICGEEQEIGQILETVLEDEVFYRTSGGGITLGGGEPLAQPQAALALLQASKTKGLHTALETCGFATPKVVESVAPFVDLFLYDMKHLDNDTHRRLTGAENGLILENLQWLMENGHNIRIRMPLINGCNADLAEMEQRAAFLAKFRNNPGFSGIDLLPYHKLGLHKYGQLNDSYTLDETAAVNDDFLNSAREIFADAGLEAAIIRH